MKGAKRRYFGTKERPRLRVSVTMKHIYAQVIDDTEGRTLASASTMDKEVKGKKVLKNNIESAKMIGEMVGKRAKAKGIEAIVFDRGERRYHGKVKSLADSARAAGLKF